MINGLEDFSLVDLAGYGGMIEDFVSYPANAKAASGMPYGSVEELDGLLYPKLSVLDPAWLTELVREIEWFRVHGLAGGTVRKTPVRGLKPPPAVTKDFLEEARKTINNWASLRMDSRSSLLAIVDPDRLPEEWTPLGGGITVEWDGLGWFDGMPDKGLGVQIPDDVGPRKEFWKVLGGARVRDFLTLRLFDMKKPFDNLDNPTFSWTSVDGDGSPGVDMRLLAKQILAVHSDCEKATTLLVLSPLVSYTYSTLTTEVSQSVPNRKTKRYKTCSDGCGTVEIDESRSPSERTSESVRTFGPHDVVGWYMPDSYDLQPEVGPDEFSYPVRLSESSSRYTISYGIDTCYGGGGDCQDSKYAVSDLWSYKDYYDRTRIMSKKPGGFEIRGAAFPDWVEPRQVWVLALARSRRLTCTRESVDYLVSEETRDTSRTDVSKGSYKSQLFMCAMRATVSSDGTCISVPEIPDIPAPDGSDFRYDVELPVADGEPDGTPYGRDTLKIDNDYAEIYAVVGVIVNAKFTASVKD